MTGQVTLVQSMSLSEAKKEQQEVDTEIAIEQIRSKLFLTGLNLKKNLKIQKRQH